jgi:hypothetical protein
MVAVGGSGDQNFTISMDVSKAQYVLSRSIPGNPAKYNSSPRLSSQSMSETCELNQNSAAKKTRCNNLGIEVARQKVE